MFFMGFSSFSATAVPMNSTHPINAAAPNRTAASSADATACFETAVKQTLVAMNEMTPATPLLTK